MFIVGISIMLIMIAILIVLVVSSIAFSIRTIIIDIGNMNMTTRSS